MRTDQIPWHFLVNPAAGRGKALRHWRKWLPVLQAALPEMTVVESTPHEGMAALAEAAVRAGKTHLVGVGGDGTHHDILNGIVRANGLSEITYAPLPLGTGNDWARTLKTPRKVGPWLKMVQQQKTMNHRVGKLVYAPTPEPTLVSPPTPVLPTAKDQRPTTWFLNVAGLAYDAEVVRRSENAPFKHRWLYPLLTLWYLKDYRPPWAVVRYDGEEFQGSVHTINIGICRYSGGGMRLVPQADPTADTLALTFARQLPVWKILWSSWRFYTGTIGAIREVTTTHATTITVTPFKDHIALEADGELLGGAPLTATLLAECLRVVVCGELVNQ